MSNMFTMLWGVERRAPPALLVISFLFTLLLQVTAISSDERVARILARHAGPTSNVQRSTTPAQSIYKTRFENVTWDNENWRVTTTNLDPGHYESRMTVANGYIGINVAAVGPFFELDTPVNGDVINGWPLFSRRQTFATISGFWDEQPTTNDTNFEWLNQYGGESVISGVPHWSGIIIDLDNGQYLDATVDPATISGFTSTLDAKGGITTWKYTWKPKGSSGASFKIAYTMFAHKLYPNQAVVQLQITPSKDFNTTIVNVIDGYSAVRTDFGEKGSDDSSIFSAVRPNGIANVIAYFYATMVGSKEVDASSLKMIMNKPYLHTNASTMAQGATANLKAGQTTTVTKYVGAASSDGFSNPKDIAKAACMDGLQMGFMKSMQAHVAEWAHVFADDTVDSFADPKTGLLPKDQYVVEAQITAVTNPYYLLQETVSMNALNSVNNAPIGANSIAVGGLGSDSYAGLIFWDADIWMQPGLVAAFPQAAQTITNYRVGHYKQAQANAQTSYTSSKNKIHFSQDAAIYSWTSGRFGNCTGTGPCWDYEYHINGDIGLAMSNYWAVTGDTSFFQEKFYPAYHSIATTFSELLTKNGSKWSLTNMTDPDEYANHVNNGGYTMALISEHLNRANAFAEIFGLEANATWTDQAKNVDIGVDPNADITLEYTGQNGSIAVKQADVVLNTYPLDYTLNYTQQDSLRDLDYYAGKQDPNGPAMTYAIFSIIANEISQSGCSAYTYQQYSEQPYARGPWFQFSEQLIDDWQTNGNTHPAYPFLTGHGGANQVVLFGYLGLRLLPDFSLHVDPKLPPQIPNLRYRTFYWQGYPISAVSNQTHTTLTRLPGHLPNANITFMNSPIPVLQGPSNSVNSQPVKLLHPGKSLTLSNRPNRKTLAGNIAQCQPVTSTSSFVPGQFPISAVDGASSTKWQPPAANVSASITILLPLPFVPVHALSFDWAQAPPVNYTVLFYNDTASDGVVVSKGTKIKVSNPYSKKGLNIIQPPSSNTTNVTLPHPVWSGKFAKLTIIGNQALNNVTNGTGASVAEFGIVGPDGAKVQTRDAVAGEPVLTGERRRSLMDKRMGRLMARMAGA